MSKFKHRYNHEIVVTSVGGESMTDRQYAADCDIYTILRKYNCGLLPKTHPVQYGDFSKVGDFNSALDRVNAATDYFASLPAEVRQKFGNDPRIFFRDVQNPEVQKELCTLGVFDAKSNPVPVTASAAEVAKHTEGNANNT